MDSPALNPAASDDLIREAESALGLKFPADYVAWLRKANGARGPIGSSNYIDLWKVESIKKRNDSYNVDSFAPGLILIGSDGGNEGYGIDTRRQNPVFVSVPLTGMSWAAAKTVAISFDEFWAFLQQS